MPKWSIYLKDLILNILRLSSITEKIYINTYSLYIKRYSQTPEIETEDLSQTHTSLNFGLLVYFIETQVQQAKIIETCV